MYLIQEDNGEKHLVHSLDGHEGCTVLEEGVTAPRVAGCERINGRWRINKDVAKRAALQQMPKEKLVDWIVSIEERLKKAGL